MLARRIRTGELSPGTQLPSRPELAELHDVSDIVIRQAMNLLRSQGLVRTVERRGVFVADRPTLVRVSPERQLESAEASFGNESSDVRIDRDENLIGAADDVASALGIVAGTQVAHIVTRVEVDGKPVSISDTYRRVADDLTDQPGGTRTLDETLVFGTPSEPHRAFLGINPGDVAVMIHQQFQTGERVDMVTDITYPTDRYASFVFRMQLPSDDQA